MLNKELKNEFEKNCERLGIKSKDQIETMMSNFNLCCDIDITKVNTKSLTKKEVKWRFKKQENKD